jgi:hypothetical protein
MATAPQPQRKVSDVLQDVVGNIQQTLAVGSIGFLRCARASTFSSPQDNASYEDTAQANTAKCREPIIDHSHGYFNRPRQRDISSNIVGLSSPARGERKPSNPGTLRLPELPGS